MRQIINISVSKAMAKDVRRAVKEENFVSISEFFRALIRDWQERKILKEVEESRAEIGAMKGRKLRSLKDLR